MRFGLLTLAIVFLGWAPQDEVTLKWGLDAAEAADYEVYDTQRRKPRLLPDRSFLIFGTELTENGSNKLIINDYRDLGYSLLFRLPPVPVKKKTRWTVEENFYEKGRIALAEMLAYKPIKMVGVLRARKFEKINGIDCVMIEGQYQYYEIKYDNKGLPKVQRRPWGKLSTIQWLSEKDTLLVKGIFAFKGKGQEFKGIKQGEEPKLTKLKLAEQIVLKPKRLKIDALANKESIDDAIKKGVDWLKSKQERNGSWVDRGGSFARDFPVGSTALCVMALLHSGVKDTDPVVVRSFQWMRKQAFNKTYEVSAMLMAFETKYLPLEKYESMESFTEEEAVKEIRKAITRRDKAFIEKAAKWLISHQTKRGSWGYPDRSESFDHSNTQYAMLALKSASRCGVKIPVKVWKEAARHWIGSQRLTGPKVPLKVEFFKGKERGIDTSDTKAEEEYDQGPWGYLTGKLEAMGIKIEDAGYGSMTCAGLTSLIIAESELVAQKSLSDRLRKTIDLSKKQGLAWLQANYSVRGNRPSAGFWSMFYYYYLYSLERVGVLYGIRKIGGHDWYQEGAMLLVRSQKRDGSWADYDDIPVVDTAFALLFLKKATIPVSTGRRSK